MYCRRALRAFRSAQWWLPSLPKTMLPRTLQLETLLPKVLIRLRPGRLSLPSALAGVGLLGGGGLLMFGSVLMSLPMQGSQLAQMQALNRELGRLCSNPPRQALRVCRLHAQLVSAM